MADRGSLFAFRKQREVALGAVMCPPSHAGTAGIFPDGSRCYVCIARSYADDLRELAEAAADVAEWSYYDAIGVAGRAKRSADFSVLEERLGWLGIEVPADV